MDFTECKCPACGEKYTEIQYDINLCPMCLEAMEEGLIKILLTNEEASIVFRKDGKIELYLSEGNKDTIASNQELLAAAIAVRLNNPKFATECLEEFDKERKTHGF